MLTLLLLLASSSLARAEILWDPRTAVSDSASSSHLDSQLSIESTLSSLLLSAISFTWGSVGKSAEFWGDKPIWLVDLTYFPIYYFISYKNDY